jgi:hypothetical protein
MKKNENLNQNQSVGIEPVAQKEEQGSLETNQVQEKQQDQQPDNEFIVKLTKGWKFCHTRNSEAYAIMDIDGHQEIWPILGKEFNLLFLKRYYELTGSVPKQEEKKQIIGLLEAKALFDFPQKDIHLRYARLDDAIYVDLCNSEWAQVKITKDSWDIISAKDSPIYFRRRSGMLPLLNPVRNGSLDILDEFINVNAYGKILIKAFLLSAINPKGPFPILILQGQQGTAKSTLTRLLKSLIDPSESPPRELPKSERDFAIEADGSWLLAYDNLSVITPSNSDFMCRISTGGGFAKRRLYTDDQQRLFLFKRPLAVNGIPDLVVRSDLADRSLLVRLETISKEQRKPEKDIMARWSAQYPLILGALYDVVSFALKNEGNVEAKELPRMADFFMWILAAEEALGWEKGSFLKAYNINQEIQNEVLLEDDPVTPFLLMFMKDKLKWNGTPSSLLQILNLMESKIYKRGKGWPKGPNALSYRLRIMVSALKSKGIDIKWARSAQRNILIEKINIVPIDQELLSSYKVSTANIGEAFNAKSADEYIVPLKAEQEAPRVQGAI